jgi:hypothetical protein
MRTSLAGGAAELFADVAGPPAAVATVDATDLYAICGPAVVKIAKEGDRTPQTLMTLENDDSPVFVLTDEDNIYVATVFNLWTAPKSGGPARLMASAFSAGIDQIEQDERNIFVLHAYDEIDLISKSPPPSLHAASH